MTEKKEMVYVIGVKNKGYIDQNGRLIQDVFNARSYLELGLARENAALYTELGDLYIRALTVENSGITEI
ncbi:hypothetical protein [Paenibacillus lactis]|uniref:hypothetical protein n=1 Tax=Paenibacillus lactis TaxID=228574 RepID=UPI003D749A0F